MPSLSSRRKTQKLGSGSLSKHYSNYGIALEFATIRQG
jgi:hypothetical protein